MGIVHPLVVVAVSFVLMEPVTALTHRFMMHGLGAALHHSHHRNAAASIGRVVDRDATGTDMGGQYGTHGFEANDAFPVMFAALVLGGMAIGFNLDGWTVLVPIGVGVTAYGVCYALVHDVYIHRRVGRHHTIGRHVPGLHHLAAAHRVHHDRNGAPYGMLLPVIGWRSGSRPSHQPDEL